VPPIFAFCVLLGDSSAPTLTDEDERLLCRAVDVMNALLFEVGGVSSFSGQISDFSDESSFHWPDSLLLIFPVGVRATCSLTSAEMFLSSGVGDEESLADGCGQPSVTPPLRGAVGEKVLAAELKSSSFFSSRSILQMSPSISPSVLTLLNSILGHSSLLTTSRSLEMSGDDCTGHSIDRPLLMLPKDSRGDFESSEEQWISKADRDLASSMLLPGPQGSTADICLLAALLTDESLFRHPDVVVSTSLSLLAAINESSDVESVSLVSARVEAGGS
jgi:hypothetical protein